MCAARHRFRDCGRSPRVWRDCTRGRTRTSHRSYIWLLAAGGSSWGDRAALVMGLLVSWQELPELLRCAPRCTAAHRWSQALSCITAGGACGAGRRAAGPAGTASWHSSGLGGQSGDDGAAGHRLLRGSLCAASGRPESCGGALADGPRAGGGRGGQAVARRRPAGVRRRGGRSRLGAVIRWTGARGPLVACSSTGRSGQLLPEQRETEAAGAARVAGGGLRDPGPASGGGCGSSSSPLLPGVAVAGVRSTPGSTCGI